ncbi:hypothetical protein CSOJ01_06812 [Colletotrichum sojae]|uniref:Uncharacterized protein n=1 Tax=Colletotrichum sojae TaxID=2175907 RepID=A0A8H6JBQ1_9PEZI|nr:hypothetical protein CSOJ01_06812 [Colletotrichum sojae]
MLIDNNHTTPAFSPAGSDEAVTNMACFSFFWVHQPLPARFMRRPQPDRGSGPDDYDDVGDEVGINPKRVSNDGHPGFIPFLPWVETAKRRSEANGVMSSPPSDSQSFRHSAGRPLLIPVAVHTSLSFQDVKLDDRQAPGVLEGPRRTELTSNMAQFAGKTTCQNRRILSNFRYMSRFATQDCPAEAQRPITPLKSRSAAHRALPY